MSGFLDSWNSYTGIPVCIYVKRDPRKSNRDIHYAGPLQDDNKQPFKLDETPEYQAIAVDCPSCGKDLHYSSGWETRTCLLCGYIEGMGGQHVYPPAVEMSEWLFVIGQLYQQVVDNSISGVEFRDEVRQITFVGSPYRPHGEYL